MKDRSLIISILLVLLACFIAYALSLYTVHDLSFEIFAALIGGVITVIITSLLLRKESENTTMQERNSKIFEEKLAIYKSFLDKFCECLKVEEVSKAQVTELQFQTAQIAMHTDNNRVKEIVEQINTIVNQYATGTDDGDAIVVPLLNIVDAFRAELYPHATISNQDEELRKDISANFSSIKRLIEKSSDEAMEENDGGDASEQLEDNSLKLFYEEIHKNLPDELRNVRYDISNEHFTIYPYNSDDDKLNMCVNNYGRFSLEYWCFAIGKSEHDKRKQIYLTLKRALKGHYLMLYAKTWCATTYRQIDEDQFIKDFTFGNGLKAKPITGKVISRDATLVKDFVEWITFVYNQSLEALKENA